jgi:hypothetical protein
MEADHDTVVDYKIMRIRFGKADVEVGKKLFQCVEEQKLKSH